MKVKLAAIMALAAVILVIAAYLLFGMSWGPAPQSNQEENTTLRLEIQQLESDLQNLELQLERLRTEHENLQQDNRELQDDLNRRREEEVRMEAEVQRLRLENQRLVDRVGSASSSYSRTGPLWFLVAVLTVLVAAFAWAWHRERQRFISSSTVRVHRPLDPVTNAVSPVNPTDTGLQKHNLPPYEP